MDFSVGCELAYRVEQPTPFVFNIEAEQFGRQTIRREGLTLTPDLPLERWRMPESGNRYLRALVPAGSFSIRYEAEITLDPHLEDPADIREIRPRDLPLSVFPHLYPSRYCQADKLERLARRTFGDLRAGHERVTGICNWIWENVDYIRGSSDELTSAFDTATERAGVCRDFAHLAIAFCRALKIPARYISAYAWRLEPPDFHAVFEAYLQGPEGYGWYLFDPTRMSAPDGLVRLGIGRDAADVAFCTPFGGCEAEKPKVWIKPNFSAPDEITTKAVRVEDALPTPKG